MPQFESVLIPPRLPLVVTMENRDGTFTKDSRLVNCYVETNTAKELWIRKRPGLTVAVTTVASSGHGVFNWLGDVYAIFNGTLFRNGVSVGSGLNQANGVYTFNQILGATPKMLFGNGLKTYAYTVAGGITSDLNTLNVNFPATNVKGIAYLNGATYVMQVGAQIWGSVVNAVTGAADWTALNFLAAQIEPDNGVALSKQLVYVISFNTWSTEVFFDAGNPVGSPLGPVQGSKISYGCMSADSVQSIDDTLFWMSNGKGASPQFSMLSQLNHEIISTKAVDRLLRASDLTNIYSFQLKLDGHSFYIVTIKNSNVTIVYDVVEGEWHQWTDADGNYFPFVAATYDSLNRHILQHETDGKLYYMDSTVYNDAGRKITTDIFTPNFDASTRRRKHLNIMEFIADQQVGSYLDVRATDNDFISWTNFRRVKLDVRKPILVNCGTFTKRAYHFRHTANTPMRMQAVEVQYDIGTL